MTKPQILIVEDEIIIAMDIQGNLIKLGYEAPTIVSSGQAAIEKTEKLQPDLILMDIKLNGEMDGIDAAKEIRERFNIPVAFLTAYADEMTLRRAKATDPIGILLKPFREREFRSFIKMALKKCNIEKD